MSEPSKFTFGSSTPAANSSSGAKPASLFSTTGAPSGNLFGGGAGAATSKPAATFNFGTSGSTGNTGNLFGSTPSQPTPASSGGGGGGGGGLFGATGTVGTSQQKPGGLFGTQATGGGWSFGQGQKKDENTPTSGAQTSATGAPSLFGATSTGNTPAFGGGGLFGGGGAASSAPTGSTTPAPAKPTLSFGSTTPAATPPATGGGTTTSLFGATSGTTPGGLFGATSGGGASGGLFGATSGGGAPGGLFGATSGQQQQKLSPFGSTTPAAPVPSPLGGGQPSGASSNVFGQNKSTTPAAGGLFGKLGQTPASTSTSNNQSTTPATVAPAASSGISQPQQNSGLFSFQKPAESSTPKPLFSALGSTTTTTSQPTPSLSFPTASAVTPQPAASTATAAPTTSAPSLFQPAAGSSSTPSLFGAKPPTTTSSAAPSSGLFSSLGQKPPTTTTTSSAPAASAATSTPATAPAAASSLFPSLGQPAASSASTSQPTATSTAAPAASAAGPTLGASTLGSSIIGGAPDARSRLKNKSMDEILTRWAADLSKYQKEFQKQAKQVQAWDILLVKNTDKISKLYAKTFQAERDAAEVEKHLAAVEGEQEEVSQWMDRYEAEVDELIRRTGGGLDGGAGGVDLERERTYKMAEKVTDRLDGLNKDLSDVIDEVNGVSTMISKSSGPDDQLSQIVRVLNSHLQQLQLIDVGTAQLNAKVEAARKETRALGASANGWSGVGSDPTEDFYRSFSSRR